MSRSAAISPAWEGRLVDQQGKRSWAGPEQFTGLRKLTATLQCRASEAETLRPSMGAAHPVFPLMLCDDRSVQETTSEGGMTYFTADYYGMRTAADEALIFQPRVRPILDSGQRLRLSIRHLHLGPYMAVKWIAKLQLPRPQEDSEMAQFVQSNPLASQLLDIFTPTTFALESRSAVQYGPYWVLDDEWGTFTATAGTFASSTGGGGSRSLRLDSDGAIISELPLIPFAGARRRNSFEDQLMQSAFIADYKQLTSNTLEFSAAG